MAAVAVLPPSGTKTATEEHMEVDVPQSAAAAAEEDLYTRLKTLQRQLEFLEIQVHVLGIHGSQQTTMLFGSMLRLAPDWSCMSWWLLRVSRGT
jgi:hypothetical protein